MDNKVLYLIALTFLVLTIASISYLNKKVVIDKKLLAKLDYLIKLLEKEKIK